MHALSTRLVRLDRRPPAIATIRLFKLLLVAGEFGVFLLSFGAVLGLGLLWLYGFQQLPIALGILLWLPSALLVFLVGGYLFLIINSIYCGLFPVALTPQRRDHLRTDDQQVTAYVDAVATQPRELTYAEVLAIELRQERRGSFDLPDEPRPSHLPRGTNKSVIVPS